MSMLLMVKAMQTKVGNPLRKLVLLKLADNANDQGECWPSLQYIADQCEISKRSVISHISALCDSGLLKKEHREGKFKANASNLYTLTMHSETPALHSANNSLGGETPALPPSETPAPRTSHSLESVKEPVNKELSVSTKHDETVKNIFAVWCEKMNSPRSRLDANRKRLITNALKKYTENDLIAAITGCAMSPFHMGINPDSKKYNGLDLILRNAEKIEQFIGFSTNPPAQRKQQAGYDFNDTSWVKDFGDAY